MDTTQEPIDNFVDCNIIVSIRNATVRLPEAAGQSRAQEDYSGLVHLDRGIITGTEALEVKATVWICNVGFCGAFKKEEL